MKIEELWARDLLSFSKTAPNPKSEKALFHVANKRNDIFNVTLGQVITGIILASKIYPYVKFLNAQKLFTILWNW